MREVIQPMSGPPSIDRSARTWRFRLWHLAVAVLAVAVMLGLLRAARDEDRTGRHFWSGVAWVYFGLGGVVILGTSLAVGFKVADRIAPWLFQPAGHREGAIGFLVTVLDFLLFASLLLVATILGFVGFVAMIAGFALLYLSVSD